MREIKFKIWSNKLSEFISGKTFIDSEGGVYVFHQSVGFTCGHDDKGEFIRLGSLTEKQDCVAVYYTGIKDKHGREIYEGDIMRGIMSDFNCYRVFSVRFDVEEGGYRWCQWSLDSLEVIGNIFENPEALEKHD